MQQPRSHRRKAPNVGQDRDHVVTQCPLCKKERETYMTYLGEVEGRYRDMFTACNSQEKKVAELGIRSGLNRREVIPIG